MKRPEVAMAKLIPDPSAEALRGFRAWAANASIPVVEPVTFKWPKNHLEIMLSPPEGPTWDWAPFAATAAWVKPDFIGLGTTCFEEDDLADSREALAATYERGVEPEEDGTGAEEPWDGEFYEEAMRIAEKSVGHLCRISVVAWQHDRSIRLRYHWTSPWRVTLNELNVANRSDDRVAVSHYQSDGNVTPEELNKLADSLSRDRGFKIATGIMQQQAAAANALSERFPRLFPAAQRQVVQRARELYLDRETLTDAELTTFAEEIAANDEFQRESHTLGRKVVAESIVGADIWARPGSEKLVVKARAIYEAEIRPARDKALREQVRAKAAEGWSDSRISRELRLSMKEVVSLRLG